MTQKPLSQRINAIGSIAVRDQNTEVLVRHLDKETKNGDDLDGLYGYFLRLCERQLDDNDMGLTLEFAAIGFMYVVDQWCKTKESRDAE